MDGLNQIQAELLKVYGSLNDPPLLYADVKSHHGDFAIIKWTEDDQYYRVQIHEEFVNEAEVWFVDYGNVLKVLKREVLAPVTALSLFAKPTFGICCQLPTSVIVASPEKWEASLMDQSIHVRINDCKNDLYFVTFTNNPLNKRLPDVLNIIPPVGKVAAALSAHIHADTPPEVKPQTYTFWDTPPSQPAWDTPPTTSRQSWETHSVPGKTAGLSPWGTPPSNSEAESRNVQGN